MGMAGGDTTARSTTRLLPGGADNVTVATAGRRRVASSSDEVSDALLRIAENGEIDLNSGDGGRNRVYTYQGKRCRARVSSKDYARFVVEMRSYKRQSCVQISARVCQLVTFVLAAVAIAIGVWQLNLQMNLIDEGMVRDYSDGAVKLRPSIPALEATVRDLDQIVTALNVGVNTAGEVVDGVQNVTSLITSGQGAQFAADVVNNATQVVGPALDDLQAAGNSIGTAVGGVLSGNSTIEDGLSDIGDAFSSFGNNLVSGLQETGQQIASSATSAFCGALSFLCEPPQQN